MTVTSPQYKVIGTRPLRPDGVDKVTGRAIYGADVKLPGLLYGKVLRSPHAHARIVAIDASAALALPGVRAVVTAHDLPVIGDKIADLGESTVNLRYASNNLLAHDKVLYYGHAVAAVAADNVHIAEEALASDQGRVRGAAARARRQAAMAADAPILLPNCAPTNWANRATHRRTSPPIFATNAATWRKVLPKPT